MTRRRKQKDAKKLLKKDKEWNIENYSLSNEGIEFVESLMLEPGAQVSGFGFMEGIGEEEILESVRKTREDQILIASLTAEEKDFVNNNVRTSLKRGEEENIAIIQTLELVRRNRDISNDI